MKKFILFTLSLISLSLKAESASENMIDFLKMEKKHLEPMFNMKLKKMQDWFDFKINAYKEFESLTDVSQKDAVIKKQLEEAIKLHKKHLEAFKASLEKEINELDSFQESLVPKKAEESTEMEE